MAGLGLTKLFTTVLKLGEPYHKRDEEFSYQLIVDNAPIIKISLRLS